MAFWILLAIAVVWYGVLIVKLQRIADNVEMLVYAPLDEEWMGGDENESSIG